MQHADDFASLRDGIVVVTGAAGGIGEQIARRALHAGAHVVASDVDADALAAVQGRLASHGTIWTHCGDASAPEAVAALERHVRDADAPLRLWVNSAGIVRREDAASFSAQMWDAVMAINVRSTLLGSQAARRLFRGGGAIVNLSSVVTTKTMPGRAAYATSKAAVEQLTKQLALEWGAEGVRVNAVAPGFILTPISHLYTAPSEEREAAAREIPLGRLGDVDDIARLVLLLGTDATAYLTGQTIAVDGGLSLA
jgi:NAD(P)-dependent dehydrogenase (short-subunit alcohol dehydrogenase family)